MTTTTFADGEPAEYDHPRDGWVPCHIVRLLVVDRPGLVVYEVQFHDVWHNTFNINACRLRRRQ